VRIVRFEADGRTQFGELEGEVIHELDGEPYAAVRRTGRSVPRHAVRLRCPVVPSKVIGIGLNYRDHAVEHHAELPKEPLMFLKAPSALIGPEDSIVLPAGIGTVDLEGELVVVVGRRARCIRSDEAPRYILGYACGNDVSARDVQKRDRMWPARSKSFDTFAPVGPWIETGVAPGTLRLRSRINGVVRQNGTTKDMVFDAFDLLSFLSHVVTLEAGDCIFTGTPAGVSPIAPGDRVEVEIDGIGILANPVRAGGAP
jgi:2-keto-4-pentenoate hydratase/2-oxohepta-3-ene-1,7-dioic acid hydratase in catechol pathway